MKLVLRALALTAVVSSAAFAEGQKCGASRFTGFFAGLNVGMSSISEKHSNTYDTSDTSTHRNGGVGPFAGLHLGYGVGFGTFGYVGASVYGNFASVKIGNTDKDGSFKRTHGFGVNVDVGGIPSAMDRTILGVGLALEWAKFKANGTAKKPNPASATERTTDISTEYRKNATKFGIRPSVFAKTFVTKNVYVGLRGSIGMFGKIKADDVTVAKNINDTAVTLEVGYKF